MKNNYEIRGDITTIFIDSPKYGRQEVLISTNKLDRVKEHPNTWVVILNPNSNSFYVVGKLPMGRGNRKTILFHRWITNAPDRMVVDHINHDTLDNTDSNLRIVTNAENLQNLKGAHKNSKTGIRGVHWDKVSKKWEAVIYINKKRKRIGHFYDIEEAEAAAIAARAKHMPFSQ